MGLVLASVLPGAASGAVLYDQTNFAGPNDWPSDDYPGSPTVSTQIADDFTVPPGQSWVPSQVDVFGLYSPMIPPSVVNVFLYSSAGSVPGTELHRRTGVSTPGPHYSVSLSGAPMLAPGAYWVSVQQAGATFMQPAWGWFERTVQSGQPAAFRNPGGGISTCTNWRARNTCFGTAGGPDQLFRLSGTAASDPVTFGQLTLNRKKGTAQLTVNVAGPGTLDVGGSGLAPRHLARRSVAAAGPVKVLIKARGNAKGKLNRKGKVSLNATVTYAASGGVATPSVQTRKVKLRKR